MKQYNATVDDAFDPHAVAVHIRDTGALVHQVLDSIGVLTFSATADMLASIRTIDGVSHIEEDRDMHAL